MATGEELGGFKGVKDFQESFRLLIGDKGTNSVEVTIDRVESSGDLAYIAGRTADRIKMTRGKELKFSTTWTAAFVRRPDGWKLHHFQGTMDPFENPFVKRKVQMTNVGFGLAAVLLPLIFFFLGRRSQGLTDFGVPGRNA
jgi:hypothetical protein